MEGLSKKKKREEYLTQSATKYIGNRVAKGMIEEYRVKRVEDVIDRYLLLLTWELNQKEKRSKTQTYLVEMTEMLLQAIYGERELPRI